MSEVLEAVDRQLKKALRERDRLQTELETARRQFSIAQKCINQIDDFLEYRWRAHSSESVRETVVGMIAEYGHDVAAEPSGEAKRPARICEECEHPVDSDLHIQHCPEAIRG